MHAGNRQWLESLKKQYPGDFAGVKVLDIGSYNVNGSARKFFNAKKYVGVDRQAGPDVDIVCEAEFTKFKEAEFDTLVYLSVFEHDPRWKEGFEHNLKWVKPGGLIIVCWGAEGNRRHKPEPWALVPVEEFMKAARGWPIEILDAFFEGERFELEPGAYDVLARKTR